MAFEQLGGIFDFGFLPPNFNANVQVFGMGNQGQGIQKWIKPIGVSMCYMLVIAGGGGGGGGFSAASTNARGGGGGGACSGMSTIIMPCIFLPDNLSILVGSGGQGGSGSGVAGAAGTNSYIGFGNGITAVSIIPNIILESGANAPGGGGAGTGAAAGSAGTVPTISTVARMGHSAAFGAPAFLVGLVGVAGGVQTGAVGVSITAGWNLIPFTPGAGGAGVNTVSTGFAGGSVTLQAIMDFADGTFSPALIVPAGVAGGAGAAGNGNQGVTSFKPFLGTGGSGGGSSDGSTGGAGGNGGIGCGGGGGGGGVTGGRGGNGGDGLVVIISW